MFSFLLSRPCPSDLFLWIQKCCSFTAPGEFVMQKVYGCQRCGVDGFDLGLCEGCALGCHKDHFGVEWVTTTLFSCDCGAAGHEVGCGTTVYISRASSQKVRREPDREIRTTAFWPPTPTPLSRALGPASLRKRG